MTDHGGSLGRARALFPQAPEPWIDLSTGINPHAYPLFELPATAFTRLPEAGRLRQLLDIAVVAYGAPSRDHLVAAPGTQILLPLVASLVKPGLARVLDPTYAEHIRAAAIAGHRAEYVERFEELAEADLAILVNPNNPDGRIVERSALLDLAGTMRRKGGLLVVDEAFMDVGPREHSVAGEVEESGLIVLKSFGKFFGLAGVRLGFALADAATVRRLDDQLGPWAVPGPALEYGIRALADMEWQNAMRSRLGREAAALDRVLARHGLDVTGGTDLFRFLRRPDAALVFKMLGRAGILIRNFEARPHDLRIGLPAGPEALARLERVLTNWRGAEAAQ